MSNVTTLGRKYGELLKSLGLVTDHDINRALAEQGKTGEGLDVIFIQNGVVSEAQLQKAISDNLSIKPINLSKTSIPQEVLDAVPIRFVHRYCILPVAIENGLLKIATADPINYSAFDDLRLLLNLEVEPLLANSKEIIESIKQYYGIGAETVDGLLEDRGMSDKSEDIDKGDIEDLTEDASIIRFVNQIMAESIQDRATDIHFEPFEDELRIRYRIDGLLYEISVPPNIRRFQSAVISRIKIMADMNIAEKRLPQDGRINIRSGGYEFDLRVSTVPTPFGESVSIRILNRSSTIPEINELGLDKESLPLFNSLIHRPYGIMLVTGPTGSGKTTSLYAALSKLNSVDKKIITIEDPIEYQMKGITQIQVAPKIGLTFATVLRSILRQDPDILLVGETRDNETAEITIRTALTGHLVFSTLHTNDAAGAVTRLLDMGVEPYLVASSVVGMIAQRLVRLICPDCKEEQKIDSKLASSLGISEKELKSMRLYKGKGCENCKFTGFKGRTAIFEIIKVTEKVRDLIVARAPASEIKKLATSQGMKTLRVYGWKLVKEGRTTIDEVLRVTQEDEASFVDVDFAQS